MANINTDVHCIITNAHKTHRLGELDDARGRAEVAVVYINPAEEGICGGLRLALGLGHGDHGLRHGTTTTIV